MAEEMHRLGVSLGLCSRSAPVLSDSDRVLARRADVTDQQAMADFVLEVEDRFGIIDLWINNAGVLEPIEQLRDVQTEDLRRHLDINVVGVFHGTQVYVRHLRRKGASGGVLVNISSGAARHPYSGWSAYCAGKSAVDRMTEVVAVEEQEIGLRAYSVAPGIIDTDMQSLIRSTPADRFPDVDFFRELPEKDAFTTADVVARKLLELAFNADGAPDEVSIDLR